MKKSLPRILIALLIFVSGAALIPFVGLPAQGYTGSSMPTPTSPLSSR